MVEYKTSEQDASKVVKDYHNSHGKFIEVTTDWDNVECCKRFKTNDYRIKIKRGAKTPSTASPFGLNTALHRR